VQVGLVNAEWTTNLESAAISAAQAPKRFANQAVRIATSCTVGIGTPVAWVCAAVTKPSKCVVEVERIKRRRQQRRAAQVAAREQQQDPNCISDSLLPGYGYDVMIASVDVHDVLYKLCSNLWVTVCKTVHSMLSDRCPILSVCLSVRDVGILWPNGWMDQNETWCGGRPRPRPRCVRWGPSSPPRRGTTPNFRPMSVVAKTGWIKMPLGMEVGLCPSDIVLDGDPAPPKRGTTPNFRPMSIVAKQSPISATAELLCF